MEDIKSRWGGWDWQAVRLGWVRIRQLFDGGAECLTVVQNIGNSALLFSERRALTNGSVLAKRIEAS